MQQFIGRAKLLDDVHARARDAGAGFELIGKTGSGKTAIVHHLSGHPGEYLPIHTDLENFNPGHPGQYGNDASVGAVQASFQQLRELLLDLVSRVCTDEHVETFRGEVVDAYNAEVADRRAFSLELAMDEVERELSPAALASAWQDSANIVADRFIAHWNDPSQWKTPSDPRPRLLLLDNFDDIADQELGGWLGDLLPKLEQTVVMLTRRTTGEEPAPLPAALAGRVAALRVDNFDREEVGHYLNKDGQRVSPDTAMRIHKITDGHPGTIALVHELLWGPDQDAEIDVDELLQHLPAKETERVAHLVERLVKAADKDGTLLPALRAATIPRRFDVPLLKALLGKDDVADTFEALGQLAFVEDVTRPGSGLPSRSTLRIHTYVRNGLLALMLQTRPDEFDQLHTKAAAYFGGSLVDEDQGEETAAESASAYTYSDAQVYDDPTWQRDKREWLYHRAHARSAAERHRALLECTRVFLEAFWWWGNYVHFDFCDQLVADLGQMLKRHEDEKTGPEWEGLKLLHESLRDLLEAYPPRSGKRAEANEWQVVNHALQSIADACGLSGSHTPKGDLEVKVQALLDVFLAHSWRYRLPIKPLADDYYLNAEEAFESDEWDSAWVRFERADLRNEQLVGDDDQSLDHTLVDAEIEGLWRSAANIVQPPNGPTDAPDHELMANLHRLRGDVAWRLGDETRAATSYRRAVLHAYLFHGSSGDPPRPDEYTLQFYVDIRARALNRILDLVAQGRSEDALVWALELGAVQTDTSADAPDAEALREQLASAIDGRTRLDLAATLFPRGPEVTDLVSDGMFIDEFRERQEAVRMLDRRASRSGGVTTMLDLHDVQWP